MEEKVEAYLGFCLRARKIALGMGTVELLKKGVYLLMLCSSASKNTFKLALKLKNTFSCPLIICNKGLENVVHKENCKIAAIRDKSLAKAISDNVCGAYELYTER